MGKQFEDEEAFKAFIENEYIKEAEEMEKEIFSDTGSPGDIKMSREEVLASYDKLKQRLIADGVYRPDPEEKIIPIKKHKEKVQKDKEKTVHNKRRTLHSLVKVVGFVVVGGLCVFEASLTTEANRKNFLHTVNYLTGNDSGIILENIDIYDEEYAGEVAALQEIAIELNIKVPYIVNKPEGMEFDSYFVDPVLNFAEIVYVYKNEALTVDINQGEADAFSKRDLEYGITSENSAGSVFIDNAGITVDIYQCSNEKDETERYLARMNIENVSYLIKGSMNQTEFEDMLKKTVFLE